MELVNNNDDQLYEKAFQELYMTTKHGVSHILQVGLKDDFTKKSAYDHVSRVIFLVPGKSISHVQIYFSMNNWSNVSLPFSNR